MRHLRPALASAVAILLASVLLAVGIVLYRPLPTIDGHVRFLGLRERGEVRRDGFGVPYILARNAYDLYFLQGYVTAQDRLFQMDLFRRVARSDSERVLGQRGRDVDAAARRLGIVESARADLARGDEITRVMAGAYSAGVNKFIDQHADDALPIEHLVHGYRASRWSDLDVVATFHAHAVGLGSADSTEARLLRSALGHAREAEHGVCWSVPGTRTLSGRALLAGELPVAARMPTLWHEVGLEDPSTRLVGFAIPGVPGVLAGRNGAVAWTLARASGVIASTVVVEVGPGAPPAQPSAPPAIADAALPRLAAVARLGAAVDRATLAAAVSDLDIRGAAACHVDARGAAVTAATRITGATGAVTTDSSGRGIGLAAGGIVDLGRARAELPDTAQLLVAGVGGPPAIDVERSRALLNVLGGSGSGPVTFAHPLTERYGLTVLDVGPVTPRYGASGRPAVRFIADLADPDRSWSVLPTGQSAHLISPHRTDQAALWGAGRLKPVGLRRDHFRIVEGNLILRAR